MTRSDKWDENDNRKRGFDRPVNSSAKVEQWFKNATFILLGIVTGFLFGLML